MAKRQITAKLMRRELKEIGYKVRVSVGSEFSTAAVFKDTKKINGANIITPEFLEEHQPFFDWKRNVSVVDDGWRTIL